MKIIQALKQIKDIERRITDLQSKVSNYCADLDHQDPVYGDPPSVDGQKRQIGAWIQSIHDSVKEIMRLRFCIQKTNIETRVTIPLGGRDVTHTIAEWIHRRRDLAKMEETTWSRLSDRGLRPQNYVPEGGTKEDISLAKPRRYYDQKRRDDMVELFASEPSTIDAKLEVVNAETDLIEDPTQLN